MKLLSKLFWRRRSQAAAAITVASTVASPAASPVTPPQTSKPSAPVTALAPALASKAAPAKTLSEQLAAISDPGERTSFALKHGAAIRREEMLASGLRETAGGAFVEPPKSEASVITDYGPHKGVDINAHGTESAQAFDRLYAMAMEYDAIRLDAVRGLYFLKHRETIGGLILKEKSLGSHWLRIFGVV